MTDRRNRFSVICLCIVLLAAQAMAGCEDEAKRLGAELGKGKGGQPCFLSWIEKPEGVEVEICSGGDFGYLLKLPCKDLKGWCKFENFGERFTVEFRDPSKIVEHWVNPWAAPYQAGPTARSGSLVMFRKDGKFIGWTAREARIDGNSLSARCELSKGE